MNPLQMIKQQQRESLDKLIEFAGSRYALAKLMGIKSPSVDGWHNRGRTSKKGAIKAEHITGGKLTRYDLRPDIDWDND
jgi:DNA-binding transcriptional regulator YdaS (Cro superfamily)